MKLHLGLIFVLALALTACDAFTPRFDPKDYPCGGNPRWHACAPPAQGMCCPLDFDCGGTPEFTGCPKGACCYNGRLP